VYEQAPLWLELICSFQRVKDLDHVSLSHCDATVKNLAYYHEKNRVETLCRTVYTTFCP